MEKKFLYLIIALVIFILGYNLVYSTTSNEIYNYYFENIKVAKIPVLIPSKFVTISLCWNKNEVNILKNEMRFMEGVRRYKSDLNFMQGFKKGFRAFYIYQKNGRFNSILYSISEKAMIVREGDFKRVTIDKNKPITVCQFPISNQIVEIFKKYEKKAPKEGSFYDNWPM